MRESIRNFWPQNSADIPKYYRFILLSDFKGLSQSWYIQIVGLGDTNHTPSLKYIGFRQKRARMFLTLYNYFTYVILHHTMIYYFWLSYRLTHKNVKNCSFGDMWATRIYSVHTNWQIYNAPNEVKITLPLLSTPLLLFLCTSLHIYNLIENRKGSITRNEDSFWQNRHQCKS